MKKEPFKVLFYTLERRNMIKIKKNIIIINGIAFYLNRKTMALTAVVPTKIKINR
ncbi:hypothetical protein [Lactovum miscens]|uniref:Uncharacterized protein n=1 Tax=Lactovum miscens TaxID=190387 RepID=A0A841C7C4_9LACT|nr:hypothetical protein [Lactovum miscens]MBB5887451.1 hypothetical protein [Lactovum miscens]